MADLGATTGKGYTLVTLADGKEYKIGLATVSDLRKLGQRLKDEHGEEPEQETILSFAFTWDGIVFMLHRALTRQGYDVTEDAVADLIPAFEDSAGENILVALGVAKGGLEKLNPHMGATPGAL